MSTTTQTYVATVEKDPDAILYYTLDWSEWLPSGLTIDSCGGAATPSSLTMDAPTNTTTTTTAKLTGGVAGQQYTVRFRVVLSDGVQQDDRSILVKVVER
jgi:hypothetical protein